MAVNNGDNETIETGAQGQERREQAIPPRQEARREQSQQSSQVGLMDLNRFLGGPITRRDSSEVLIAAVKAAKFALSPDRIVASSGQYDVSKIEVLGLEASEHQVSISSVIVALPVETNNGLSVLVSMIALAGSMNDAAQVRNFEQNGRSYPIPVLAGDYITEGYLSLVDEIVKKKFEQSRRSVEIVRTGWNIALPTVHWSEPESTEVRNVMFYTMASLTSAFNEMFRNDAYFNLDWFNKQATLEINIDVSGRESYTADGQPRRNDIGVTVAGVQRRSDNQHVTMPLSTIGGHVELVYVQPETTGISRRSIERDQPIFQPVYVINRMDSSNNVISPELLLLALAGASVLTKDERWAQTFLPTDLARGETDYRDTGLLNVLRQTGDNTPIVFDGRSSLDTDKWADYFFSLVDEKLVFAIELEEGGENSWITGLLSDAANDNTPDADAVRRLYSYADRLTMGHFTRRAKELGVESPLMSSGARYLTGTWIDENGKTRDLRDWDMLRWLAVNPNDNGDSALRYQDVVNRTDLDVEIRISEQYEQLAGALTPSGLKFGRYVELAYINPDFIKALALAVTDCKVNVDASNASYSFGNRRLRGNSRVRDFAGGDLSGGMASGRRTMGDGSRGYRGGVGNGFGHGAGF